MTTRAANLYPAPKIRLETQCIYQVRTGQFTISGTVLNIFSSADRDDIKVKSSIFPFALKAKQKKKKVCFHLVCGQIGHVPWNAGLLWLWNMTPVFRGKQRCCSWQCRGLCWWKRSLNASPAYEGQPHCSLALEWHSTAYNLVSSSTESLTETSTSSWFLPVSSEYRKPLLWSIRGGGGQAAAELGLCSAARSTSSTHYPNQPVQSWSILCSM